MPTPLAYLKKAAFAVMVLFCCLLGIVQVNAQSNSYVFTSSTGSYTTFTGGTVWQSGSTISTNAVTNVSLPSSFTFNGTSYSAINISNNGFITFGSTAPTASNYAPISSSETYAGAIAGYGLNMVASPVSGTSPEIRYGTSGSEFVVQFQDLGRTGITGDRINFQIRLNTSTKAINIVYGTTAASTSTTTLSNLGQVGIRGASNSDYAIRFVNSTSPYNAWSSSGGGNLLGTSTGSTSYSQATTNTILYNSSYLPASGLTYTWTPNGTYNALPLTENFENSPWQSRNSLQDADVSTKMGTYPPIGNQAWKRQGETTTNSLWTTTSGGLSALGTSQGTGAARFHSFNAGSGTKGVMDFYVDFSTVGSKQLVFDYTNASGTDALKVYLSTDGGITFGSALATYGTQSGWVTQSAVSLGSSTSATCVVRLEATSDYGNDDIGVDNIAISISSSPCAAPTAAATALVFSGNTASTVAGSFTAATTAPTGGYLTVISTSSTLSAGPTDGTAYTVGTSLGGGTVIGNSTGTTFSYSTGLSANTQYYVFVIPYNYQSGTCSQKYGTGALILSSSTYTCPAAPTALTATTGNITSSTAQVSWTAPSGTITDYTLQYRLSPSGSWTTVNSIASSPYTINGLAANTAYDFQVSANNSVCGSSYATAVTFTTKCSSTSISIAEGFNTSSTSTFPTCWTTTQVTGTTSVISFETTGSNPTISSPSEGTRMMKFNSYSVSSGNQIRVVSLPVSTTGNASVDVTFDWYEDNTAYTGSGYSTEGVTVQWSTDGATWTNSTFFPRVTGNTGWYNKRVTLPAGAGNQSALYVGLLFTSKNGDNCFLDRFTIEPSVSTCSAPTAAATGLVFTGNTSAIVAGSFTPASTAPTGGYLVIRSTSSTLSAGPTDGTAYTVGASIGGGTVIANNNPTTYTFSSSGLSANTQYYVFVIPYNYQSGVCTQKYGTGALILSGGTYTCPAAPTALTAATANITSSTAQVSWTAPSGTITDYSLQYRLSPSGSWTTVNSIAASPYTINGLAANTAYDFQVSANNSVCGSSYATAVTFTTKCASTPISIAEGFNTSGTSTLPSCWATTQVTGTSSTISFETSGSNPTISSPSEGTRMMKYNSYNATSGNQIRVVSLPVSTSSNASVDVTFDWYEDNTAYTGSGYSSEGVTVQWSTDGATWTNSTFFPRVTGNTGWYNKRVTLPSGAGNQGTLYVGLLFTSKLGDNCFLDRFTIEPSVSCAAPTSVTVNSVTSSSASAAFTCTTCSPGNAYVVEYGPTGFTPGTGASAGVSGTVVTGTASPIALSGLAANTTYDVYARQNCTSAGSGYSANSIATSFTTLCGTTPITVAEGFNTSSVSTLPACWAVTQVTGTSSTITFETIGTNPTISSPSEGTRMMKFNSYNASSGDQIRAVSLPVSTTSNGSVDVTFDWYEDNTAYTTSGYSAEGVTVQWSTNGTTWTSSTFFPRVTGNTGWYNKRVTLPAGAGNQGTLYVGLLFTSKLGDNCFLDRFTIEPTPAPSCVTSVTPLNATLYPANTVLSWTAVSGASSYDVYFGTNQTNVNNQTAGVLVTNTAGTTYTPSGMSAQTYYWKVVPKNATGAATGCASNSFIASLPLCGTYTINNTIATGGTNFNSFTDAISSLNALGISCSVKFKVKDGQTFNEYAPAITATGTATNTITFVRDSSGASKPKLVGTTGTGSTDAVLKLTGSDYITINGIDLSDNLTANTTATTRMEYGLFVAGLATNGCRHNVLQNSSITLNTSNSNTTRCVYLSSVATSSAGTNDSNYFINNVVQNAMAGYTFVGTSSYYDSDNEISDGPSGGTSAIQNIGTSSIVATMSAVDMQYQKSFWVYNTAINNVASSTNAYGVSATVGSSSFGYVVGCKITNISGGSSSEARGIYITNGTNFDMEQDTIQGVSSGSFVSGIYVSATGYKYYYDNIIGGTGSLGITGGGNTWGIFSDYGTTIAENNTITNIITTSAATQAFGIKLGSNSTSVDDHYIEYNKICSVKNTNAASTSLVCGIDIQGDNYQYTFVANNYISDIRNDNANGGSAPAVRGLSLRAGEASVYYNTVYLSGTATNSAFEAAAFYFTYSSGYVYAFVKNNIFYNNYTVTTGTRAAAIYYGSSDANYIASLALSSNNNLLYAGTPGSKNVICYTSSGSKQTLANYKAMSNLAPTDSASLTGQLKFVNVATVPYDLHVDSTTNCLISGKGLSVASYGFTDDYDGQTRSTGVSPNGPDIGADEFNFNPETKATITTNPVCQGDALTIAVSTQAPSPTYTWAVPSGITNPAGAASYATATATLTNSGHYTVTVTDNFGCISSFDSTVVVNALPTATASNTGPYVAGQTISLSSGTGASYSWSGPNTYSNGTQNPSIANSTTAMAGTYTVTVTSAAGCTATATTNVVVISNTTTWTANAGTTDWFTSGNWTNGVPTILISGTIPAGRPYYPQITGVVGQIAITKDLTIQSGGSVTVLGINGVGLEVHGNLANSGTASMGAGKVTFNGSGAQTISGLNLFKDLEIDNTAGVTIVAGSSNMQKVRGALNLKNGTLTTNGNITITSDASGAGLVNDFTSGMNGQITGNIKVERYADNPSNGFYYIGSPVTGAATNQWASQFSMSPINNAVDGSGVVPDGSCSLAHLAAGSPYGGLFDYRENTVTYCNLQGWHVRLATSAPIPAGQGFAGRVPDATTIALTGTYTTGSVQAPVMTKTTANTTASKGYNLVSNPYASPLDWVVAAGTSGPNNGLTDGNAYVYHASGAYSGTYLAINNISGSINGSLIGSSESFFVKTAANGNRLTFNNSMRSTGTNGFLRTARPYSQLVTVNLSGNGFADLLYVAFDQNLTSGFDYGFDASKLKNKAGQPNIYATDGADHFSIFAVETPQAVRDVPVAFEAGTNGNFSLNFNLTGFDPTALVILEDTKLNTFQNLLGNASYAFSSSVSDDPARFILHFVPAATITTNAATCAGRDGAMSLDLGSYSVAGNAIVWNTYSLTGSNGNAASFGSNVSGSVNVYGLQKDTYTLTLTYNGYTVTQQVVVTGATPVTASITASTQQATTNDLVQFTATTTGATTYDWVFGDGSTSSLSNPTHAYADAGTYTIEMVADNGECTATATTSITVQERVTGIGNTALQAVQVLGYGNNVAINFTNFSQLPAVVADIYDLTGRKIIASQTVATGDNHHLINVGSVVPGYYFVVLTGKGYEKATKVFLTHEQ